MRRLLGYSAAIFDLDGTLADSMRVWDGVFRRWLGEKGIRADGSLERGIAAMTLSEAAAYAVRRYTAHLSPADVLREWEEIVLDRYRREVPLKEGAADLVKALAARGVKLGIASSTFPAACEEVLSRHGLRALFSALLYTDESMRDKSYPDVYLACAARLGAAPADCIVFEDLPQAAQGVRAAGMGLAAVYDESHAAQWAGFKRQADIACKTLRELQ